jgi:hypothetical protein
LSGGGQPTQTFREAKQRKDQALAQLSPQAAEMCHAAEDIAEVLVKLRARFGSGTVKASRPGAYGVQTDVVDMAELKESGWHAEADASFPTTEADRRDAVYSMLKEMPPDVQQALSIIDPLNIDQLFDLLQVPGFESAVRDQKKKTLADIQQLLAEQPIPGPPGPDGQPGLNQPSIPPDTYDNHVLVSMLMQKWLIGNQEWKQKSPGGFLNVEARLSAEMEMAKPAPPPEPPPVRASLAFSAKAEDFPNQLERLLEAGGVPASTAPAPTPAPGLGAPPAGAGAPGNDMGTPAGVGEEAPESPIPPETPLPGGPNQ